MPDAAASSANDDAFAALCSADTSWPSACACACAGAAGALATELATGSHAVARVLAAGVLGPSGLPLNLGGTHEVASSATGRAHCVLRVAKL